MIMMINIWSKTYQLLCSRTGIGLPCHITTPALGWPEVDASSWVGSVAGALGPELGGTFFAFADFVAFSFVGVFDNFDFDFLAGRPEPVLSSASGWPFRLRAWVWDFLLEAGSESCTGVRGLDVVGSRERDEAKISS